MFLSVTILLRIPKDGSVISDSFPAIIVDSKMQVSMALDLIA